MSGDGSLRSQCSFACVCCLYCLRCACSVALPAGSGRRCRVISRYTGRKNGAGSPRTLLQKRGRGSDTIDNRRSTLRRAECNEKSSLEILVVVCYVASSEAHSSCLSYPLTVVALMTTLQTDTHVFCSSGCITENDRWRRLRTKDVPWTKYCKRLI